MKIYMYIIYSSILIWTEMLGDISLFYEAANGRFYTSATGNGAVKGNGGMRGLLGFHLRCHSASLIYCKSSSYIKEKKRGSLCILDLRHGRMRKHLVYLNVRKMFEC